QRNAERPEGARLWSQTLAGALVFFTASIVSPSCLGLVTLLSLDFQLAVGAVALQIGRCIPDVVLAAQLSGDLVKGLAQLVELVSDIDNAPAGLLGEFAHIALARVPEATIESTIGTEQNIDNRIRFLCRLNR